MFWGYLVSLALVYGYENLASIDLELSLCNGNDIREITIKAVHELYATGALTTLELTRCYLQRINHMNPKLNAIIEINPNAIKLARTLDYHFNKTGQFIGPLHGIPIFIKDNIATRGKMNTTAGSWALLGAKPKKSAKVVRKLQKAGALILGKTSMSEFAGGRGGQTIYPYKLNARPYESSSGSAVAIAANLAIVALGTDTEGSIINPSAATSLVGSKPSVGLISSQGVIPLAPSQDSVGVLARTLRDNILVTVVLSSFLDPFRMINYSNFNFKPLKVKNLRVGLIDFPDAKESDVNTQRSILKLKLNKLTRFELHVTKVKLDINRSFFDKVTYVYLTEFKHHLNQYLRDETLNSQPIKSLEDVIKFNKNHPHLFPISLNQDWFQLSQSTTGIEDLQYLKNQTETKMTARRLIDELMDGNLFNALITLSHPSLGSNVLPSVAGYPILTIPLGIMEDGSPFGVTIYSKWGYEHAVYSLAHALDPKTSAVCHPSF